MDNDKWYVEWHGIGRHVDRSEIIEMTGVLIGVMIEDMGIDGAQKVFNEVFDIVRLEFGVHGN